MSLQDQIGEMMELLEEFRLKQLRSQEDDHNRSKTLLEHSINDETIKDLRQEIESKYDREFEQNLKRNHDSSNFLSPPISEEQKKKNYIDDQLSEYIKKIEQEKEKERSRHFEMEPRKKTEKDIERERDMEISMNRSLAKLLGRNRSTD